MPLNNNMLCPLFVRLICCILLSEIPSAVRLDAFLSREVSFWDFLAIVRRILRSRALEMPVFHPKDILDFPIFVSSYARCRLLDEIIPQAWGWLYVLMSEMPGYTKGEKEKKKVCMHFPSMVRPVDWDSHQSWNSFMSCSPAWGQWLDAPECRVRLNSYQFSLNSICWGVRIMSFYYLLMGSQLSQ